MRPQPLAVGIGSISIQYIGPLYMQFTWYIYIASVPTICSAQISVQHNIDHII